MNPMIPGEKFATSQKSNVDAFHSVASLTLDRVERTFGLTMDLVRATVEDGTSVMHSMLTAETADQRIRLQSGYNQAHVERTIAYVRNLSELSEHAQRDLTELAQRWLAEQQEVFAAAVEAGARSVTADPQAVMTAINSAASASKDLYERVRQAGVPLPSEDPASAPAGDGTARPAGKSSASRKAKIADEGEA